MADNLRYSVATGNLVYSVVTDNLVYICEPVDDPCEECDTDTTQFSRTITFGGSITDNDCEDCANILSEGPYVITQNPLTPCELRGTFDTDCGSLTIVETLTPGGATLTVEIDSTPEHTWSITGLSDPFDCLLAREYDANSDASPGECDWTNVTVESV
jgi:hypothetical protein